MKRFKTYLILFFGIALFGSATQLVSHNLPVFIAGGMRVLLAFNVLLPLLDYHLCKKYNGKNLCY